MFPRAEIAPGIAYAAHGEGKQKAGFAAAFHPETEQPRAQIDALENRIAALLKADERKNIFLGTLAHEIRNLLAPLANAVQLLRLKGPNDSKLDYPVKLIERQVEFLRRLVDDLLDVARIGAGKIELKKGPVPLAEVLGQVVESCRSRAEERRQHVEVILPAGAIVVEGDASRLQQVFTNLMTNAVKYTPEEGRIWVKATIEGKEAAVDVEDTGVGISAEMLPKIFDLFTQEEESRYQSEGGLGIGLSLVKSLVTLHGGTVQVRSGGKGKGSQFTVRLPLTSGTAEEVRPRDKSGDGVE